MKKLFCTILLLSAIASLSAMNESPDDPNAEIEMLNANASEPRKLSLKALLSNLKFKKNHEKKIPNTNIATVLRHHSNPNKKGKN